MERGIHQMQMEDTLKDLACNILYYNTYHNVTIAHSIQYSNMLYRFVA